MGVWDKTTPVGLDQINGLGTRLRELKDALEEALSHEDSTFPGATPSSTPILIPGMKRGTTGNRPTGDSLVSGRFYANTTLNILERYNGSSWDSISANIPVGSKAMFYQASAPTGWTAVAVNDKFLRVVTTAGSGGTTGGTVAASSSLAHTHDTTAHTHSISADGSHNHTRASGSDHNTAALGARTNTTNTEADHDHGAATGSTSPTTDSKLGVLAYADVIIATKD